MALSPFLIWGFGVTEKGSWTARPHSGLSGDELTSRYLACRAADGPLSSRVEQTLSLIVRHARFMPRPVFLGAGQLRELETDLLGLMALLRSLPDRLCGGDLRRFAGVVGLTELQAEIAVSTSRGEPARLARPDMFLTAEGFRLLEVNMTSSVGLFDSGEIGSAMLDDPVVAWFAREHGLVLDDPLDQYARMLLAELAERDALDTRVVALCAMELCEVDRLGAEFFAILLSDRGFDAFECDVSELEHRDGRLWFGAKAVDVVWRFVNVEEVNTANLARLEPLLSAHAQDAVAMFTPFDGDLYGGKGSLALVSSLAGGPLLTEAESGLVTRLLPWTRMLAARPDEDLDLAGVVADAERRQEELVLKPAWRHGGDGVVLGWAVSPVQWRESLAAAIASGEAHVLQERVYPVREICHGDQEMTVLWSPFLLDDRFAGFAVRSTLDASNGLVSVSEGARIGCCLHAAPEMRTEGHLAGADVAS